MAEVREDQAPLETMCLMSTALTRLLADARSIADHAEAAQVDKLVRNMVTCALHFSAAQRGRGLAAAHVRRLADEFQQQ